MFPEIPQNLAALNDEELATLESKLQSALNAIVASGVDLTDEARDAAVVLQDVEAIIATRAVMTELASGMEDRIREEVLAAITAQLSEQGSDEPASEIEVEGGPVDPGEQAADAEEDAEKIKDDAEGDDDADDEGDPSPSELGANDTNRVPARPADTTNAQVTLATDLRGHTVGEPIADLDSLAGLLSDAAKRLPDPSGNVAVASITLADAGPAFTDNADHNGEIIAEVTRTHDTAESLVAAGGWCRPSDYRYDFFSIEASGGMVDLPEVSVSAGLRYPVSPSINDLLATDALWLWTEADDITAASNSTPRKTELRIPCVTFEETRLDAHGVTLRHGNLSDRAWPSLTKRITGLTLAAHNHTVNSRFLAAMASDSTPFDLTQEITVSSVTAAFLHAVTLRAEVYRDLYKMDSNALLEVVAPDWIPGSVQTDVSKREGLLEINFEKTRITSALAARNIRVQWVDDWQNLSASAEEFPSSADFLLYAPGTWVRGNGGSLDLGVVRDSTLNAMNDHTALWTEQFLSLMKFGYRSERVTFPVKTTGATYSGSAIGS